MLKPRKSKIHVSDEIGTVSTLLIMPSEATALLVLSHGAGAGMGHPFMEMLSQRLAIHGIGTLRFNFAYMERGGGPPDRPIKAQAIILAAVKKAKSLAEGKTIAAGGKSFGGRMTSLVAAQGELSGISGIIYYGYPLHRPGKPGVERANHLSSIEIPQLFLQGDRDTLANIDLMKKVCEKINNADLVVIEGGDHSFKTLKRSMKTHEEAVEELAKKTADFLAKL